MQGKLTCVQDQMSIRRKTCETMTLLYEAALKTNPASISDEDERPRLINPIPGVQPRAQVGKAIWVPDPHREGGGIWVAQDEAMLESSGLTRQSVVLASELQRSGSGSQSSQANGHHGQMLYNNGGQDGTSPLYPSAAAIAASGPGVRPASAMGDGVSPASSGRRSSALPNLGHGLAKTAPNSAASHTSFADLQMGRVSEGITTANGSAQPPLPPSINILPSPLPQGRPMTAVSPGAPMQTSPHGQPGSAYPQQDLPDLGGLQQQQHSLSAAPPQPPFVSSLPMPDMGQMSGMPFSEIQSIASNLNPNLNENLGRSAHSVLPFQTEYNLVSGFAGITFSNRSCADRDPSSRRTCRP